MTKKVVVEQYRRHPLRSLIVTVSLALGFGVLATSNPISAHINPKQHNQTVSSTVSEQDTTQTSTTSPDSSDSLVRISGPDSLERTRLLKSKPIPHHAPIYTLTGHGQDGVHKLDTPVQVSFDRTDLKSALHPTYKVHDPYGKDAAVTVNEKSVGNTDDVTLIPNSSMGNKPGRYTVDAVDPTTGNVVSTQEFVWGVLAFNPDYSVYPVNTPADLSMAVLDDGGKTVCNAAVMLKITAPDGAITMLGTGDGSVVVNEECWKYQEEKRPDYEASFSPALVGTYQVEMTATFNGAERTLNDGFTVDANSSAYIKRTGPTRTWPGAHYDYQIDFQPQNSGDVTVTESVPSSFEITHSVIGNSAFTTSSSSDRSQTILTWHLTNIEANQHSILSYRFQTPSIYPYIYKLGPATVKSATDWIEPRQWSIASDATCTSQTGSNGNWNTAGNWDCGHVPTTTDTVVISSVQSITIDSAPNSVISVTINNGATLTSGAAVTLTIGNTAAAGTSFTNNGTFTASTGKITLSSDVSLTAFSGSLTGSNKFNNLDMSPAQTGDRTYTGGAAIAVGGAWQVIPSGDSGTRVFIYNLGGAHTVTGAVTVNHGATSSATVNTTSGSNWALTAASISLSAASNTLTANNSLVTLTGTSGTLFTKAGTLTAVGTTSEWDITSASGSPSLFSAATALHILKINAAATVVNLGNNLSFDTNSGNKLWIAAGVFNEGNRTITQGTNGTFQIDAGATYCHGGTSASTNATCNSAGTQAAAVTFPSFTTYTFDPTSTVIYLTNNSSQIVDGDPVYGNLTLMPKMSASVSFAFEGSKTPTINGNFKITPTATAGSCIFTVNLAGTTIVATTKTTTIQPDSTNSPAAILDLRPASTDYNFSSGFIDLESSGTLDGTSSSSTITLTGTSGTLFTINSGTYTQGTTTMTVTSASGSPKLLSVATTFHILTINAAATLINDGAAVTINNASGAQLYVQSGVFNAFNAITGPGSGNGTLQIDSGGTLCLGGTDNGTTATCDSGSTSTTSRTLPTFQTYTFNAASTVIYLSDAATTVDSSQTFGNLNLTPKMTASRTYTMGGAMTINGNFNIKPNASSGSLAFVANLAGTATVAATKTTTIQAGSTNSPTAKLASTASDFNLSTGLLNIDSQGGGGTLDINNATLTITGTSGTLFTKTGTFTVGGSSTTIFNGDGSPTALTSNNAITFDNLQLTPAMTTSRSYAFGTSALTINGNFDIKPTASAGSTTLTVNPAADITVAASKTTTIDAGNTNSPAATLDLRPASTDYNLSTGLLVLGDGLGGNNTLDAGSSVSTITLTATSGTLFTKSATGVFTQGTSTVLVTGAGSTTLLSAATTFHKLTINNSSNNVGAGAAITMSNADAANKLYIQSGTLDDGGNQIAGTSNGSMQMDSGTSLKIGSGTATVFPTNYTNGIISLNAASTVVYNATVNQTISGVPTYGHLQLSRASGTPTKTLGAATTINGNLTIDSSNTLDTASGSSFGLIVKGNYTNNGTFTARSGLVTLSGTSQQTVSGNLTSSSAFYDLTISNSTGTDASDCERTSFVPSIIFSTDATSTHNLVATTASVRIQYHTGSTYTFANINWNGQASGTRLYFRNSATSGTWLLNVSGTQTAVSYVNVSRSDASGGSQIAANDGTNVDCNNNTNWNFSSNQSPSTPTSLTQKKVTGGTTLSTGDWTNETQVQFTVSASDPDASDTLYLCVEKDILGVTFSDTEDSCGSGVAYSGSPVTLTVTITSQTDASEYHWQARVKDAASSYSSWVQYGGNAESARDYGIDTTAPTTAGVSVYDGTSTGVDASQNGDGSLAQLSANWDAFTSTASGLNKYQYSIGSTSGGTDILTWTDNSTTASVTATSLSLHTGQLYFFNVRAVDNATNTSSVVSSNGQYVSPTLTFAVSPTTITFSNLNSSNNFNNTQDTTLTTSTNSYNGYQIKAYRTALLTFGASTIPDFAAGSYATPAAWGTGQCATTSCGFGYTSSDTTIGGSDLFAGATKYAPFASSGPGDVVADHTATVTGTAISNEIFTVTNKVATLSSQNAGTYTTQVVYTIVPTY